jgi:hypothetical protein
MHGYINVKNVKSPFLIVRPRLSLIPEGRDTISPTGVRCPNLKNIFGHLTFLRCLYRKFFFGKSHHEVRLTGPDVSKQSNVFFVKGSEVLGKRRSHYVPRKVVVCHFRYKSRHARWPESSAPWDQLFISHCAMYENSRVNTRTSVELSQYAKAYAFHEFCYVFTVNFTRSVTRHKSIQSRMNCSD